MAHDRFDERHSFNVLGFIQLLYDTTCINSDFWVKPVWGLGWRESALFCPQQFYLTEELIENESKQNQIKTNPIYLKV